MKSKAKGDIHLRDISKIKPFEEELDLYYLPKVRIIGKEVRNGGALGNTAPALWDDVFRTGENEILRSLSHFLGDCLFGWTCDYEPETDTFSYIVCAMANADTPVPEGFVYRDIPETICAKGLYGEDMSHTLERIEAMGYTTNWETYGWNAELYIDAEEEKPPKQVDTPWHWLVPVRKIDE